MRATEATELSIFFGGAPRLPYTDTLPRARQLHANPELFACDFVKVNTLDGNVSSGQVQRSRLANTGCLIKWPVSIGVLCSETLLRVAIRGFLDSPFARCDL